MSIIFCFSAYQCEPTFRRTGTSAAHRAGAGGGPHQDRDRQKECEARHRREIATRRSSMANIRAELILLLDGGSPKESGSAAILADNQKPG
jgi:hypothetical protein